MPNPFIRIIFTKNDVADMAEELGVSMEVALRRAESWASAIEETATELIANQLYGAIEHDQP